LTVKQSQEIALTNRLLNFVLARGWTNYDNFSTNLARRIISSKSRTVSGIVKAIDAFHSPFFRLNGISKKRFIENFPVQELVEILGNTEVSPITFLDVFPETSRIDMAEGKKSVSKLNIEESVIQNAIRDSLREKNATNAIERGHDSVLEVADHEHFSLDVKGSHRSFAGVVKGYRSLGGAKTVNWEKIAHQVVRAHNRTHPDHVLLVLAKAPADSVISELQQYADSIDKPTLMVLCDPVTLGRFLRARGII
jgi:hypothetical protein